MIFLAMQRVAVLGVHLGCPDQGENPLLRACQAAPQRNEKGERFKECSQEVATVHHMAAVLTKHMISCNVDWKPQWLPSL